MVFYMRPHIREKSLLSFILKSLWPYRVLLFFLFLVSFTWTVDTAFWPLFFRFVIDELVAHETTRQGVWEGLKWILLYGAFLWILIETGFRVQGFLMAKLLPRLEADIRLRAFDHVQHHSPQYFNERFAGNLANKITDLTTQITILIQQCSYTILPATASFFIASFFMWEIHPLLAVALFLGISIHLVITFTFTKKCEDLENIHSDIRSSLLGRIVDSLTNNLAVNLFFRFKEEHAFVTYLQGKELSANYQAKCYIEIMKILFGISCFLISGLTLNGLMVYLWMDNKLSTGEVAQIFNTSGNIIMAMWVFSMSVPQLYQAVGIAKQAYSVMSEPSDLTDVPGAKPLTVTAGEIIFDKVHFHYGDHHLFQNKNVKIKGGEKVGLVGYSGSGKSTFVSLILRMFPVASGRILIDGQDIAKYSLESLRSQISLIPQDPLLFHRSIEENIRYGRPSASVEEVRKAAEQAHCDTFIQKLPFEYESEVGERGTKLSGGERQRIAIARAFLSCAPVLILDEATSALDSITERYIHESLRELMKGRTAIVIAHRLSTLAEMDRLLVFHHGKIVEEGSHEELLTKNGHYAHMWRTQAEGFLPETNSSS